MTSQGTLINGDTLLLRNVTTDMSGNYSCEVSNHITNQRKSSPNKIVLRVQPATKNEKSRLIHRPLGKILTLLRDRK